MKWFEWKSFASRSIDKFCSLQDLLRLRGGVTDAWSRSANFNCAASMRPRRFLGCGPLRLPLCNSGKPDEMTVRPETRGRDGEGNPGSADHDGDKYCRSAASLS